MPTLDDETIADRKARILRMAREIIEESGDFSLPMRALAARAQVSLRAPYDLFGSKVGVIQAILSEDIEIFGREIARHRSEYLLDYVFDRLRLGIDFYRERQPFYRSLSRVGHSGGGATELDPEQLGLTWRQQFCRRLRTAQLIVGGLDPDLIAETLNNTFYGVMREWAWGDFDIERVNLKVGFGYANILAGVTPPTHAATLRERALTYQRQLAEFESAARAPT